MVLKPIKVAKGVLSSSQRYGSHTSVFLSSNNSTAKKKRSYEKKILVVNAFPNNPTSGPVFLKHYVDLNNTKRIEFYDPLLK